jgi:TonB-linked SusC/RagA family outer membrane protein
MKNRFTFLLIITMFTVVAASGYAQNKEVKGIITDAQGLPIPGTNVIIKGTQNATSSNFDGNYTISVAIGKVLVFSSTGSKSVEKVVGQSNVINVILNDDISQLNEVVVIGYGTQKKSDVTGAISSITSEDINAMPVQNVLQGAQGKVAGIVVTSNARPGEIGSVTIRGNRSISGGNGPLYVVDGVPLQSGGIEMFNSNDIESMEVLKDASATAIYGSRGSNGVILLTTKKGKKGKTQIVFNTSVTYENLNDLADYYDAGGYADYRRDALRYAGLYKDGSGSTLNYADPVLDYKYFGADKSAWENIARGYTWVDKNNLVPAVDNGIPVYNGANIPTTDWTDSVLQTGLINNNTLGISMGTDKVKTYASIGVLNQTGTVAGQDFKRYTGLLSMELNATDWLTFGGTLNVNYSVQNYGYSGSGSRGSAQLYSAARSQYPFAVAYDEEGNYIFNPGGSINVINPIRDKDLVINERTTARMFGSFFAEIKLADGFRYKAIFGPDVRNFRNGQYQYAESSLRGGTAASTNYARLSKVENLSWTFENLLYYDKTFNDKHTLGVTLLQSSSYKKGESSDMTATDLPYDSQLWHNLGSTNRGALDGWGSGYSKQTLTSYMARVNYAFNDKYLFTATARADGSSVLSEGNKWDFFPSTSLGWKINEEDFLKDVSWVKQLKLRAGYGTVGNQSVEPYGTAGGLVPTSYLFGSTPAKGFTTGDPKGTNTGSIANKDLGWEKTKQLNFGLDFGFFNNRITGSVDYYIANTFDILLDKTPNSVTGYGSITVNAGKTRNKGVEVQLSTVNVENKDFRWTSDVTFTKNKSEIVSLVNGKVDDVNNRWFIGQPISVVYDYKKTAIWQLEDAAEMKVYNDNGATYKAGDIRVEDVNNDGIIDANNDRQILGTTNPDWTAGFTNTFSYKNLELSAFIYSSWGQIMSGGAVDLSGQFVHRKVDYWTPNNPTNAYPAVNYNNGGVPIHYSSMNYQDGSFVKLRYVSLGYNMPQDLIEKLGMSKLKIYTQAINPYLYSKTDFMDNDSNYGGNNSTVTTRSFVFGINASF